jgi:hypothetical protein
MMFGGKRALAGDWFGNKFGDRCRLHQQIVAQKVNFQLPLPRASIEEGTVSRSSQETPKRGEHEWIAPDQQSGTAA